MDNNTNSSNDKGKIMVLTSLIIAVSIMLVVFVFLAVIDLTHKEASSKISTTTRRTVKQDEESTTDKNNETSSVITSTTVPVVTDTSTTKTTTVRPTTKVTTTKVTTPVEEKPVIPNHNYDIAYDATVYPDAIDSWEWEIVNLINKERRKNGLNELLVARELRNMAEEAAYMYYASGSEAIKPYLNGYSYLYMHSNLIIDANTLYESTINSTKITTNPDIKYIGVGVLKKNVTLDTYFYVMIYE